MKSPQGCTIAAAALTLLVACSGSSPATSSSGSSGGSTTGTTSSGTTGGTSGSPGAASLSGSVAWSPASADLATVLIDDGGQGYAPDHMVIEIDGEATPDCQGRGAPPNMPVLRIAVAVAANQRLVPGTYVDAQLTATELSMPDGGAMFPQHGSLTLSALSPDVTGSFTLDFGGDSLSGSFDAPFCN